MNISEREVERRHERLRDAMRRAGVPTVVAFSRSFFDRPGPVGYLTGYLPSFPSSADAPGVRGLGQAALVMPAEDRPVLIADGFARGYQSPFVRVAAADDVAAGVATELRSADKSPSECGLVGGDIVPHALFAAIAAAVPGTAWRDFDEEFTEIRRRKSPEELAGLRHAAEVARIGFEAAIEAIRPGATERDVCAAGTAAALRAGTDFVRYLRVHAGQQSAGGSRWPPATDVVIQAGDLVTMDLVGAAEGYGFDLLRTAAVGRSSEDALQLLRDEHTVEQAALGALRAGQTVEGLIETIRAAAAGTRSAAYLSSFYGHGIGLETLERPYLIPGQSGALHAGDVLCIEPGLFRSGFGGAVVEDEVVVTDGGCELLSPYLRQPIVV